MRRMLLATIAAGFMVVMSAPVWAHVTVQPTEAPTGAFFRFVVRVPNERPNADTTKVEVQFPDGLFFVSFQPKDGWKRTVKMKKLAEPVELFGQEFTEAVDTVTWSGSTIKPGEFEEFGFSARLPEQPGTLRFPALQTYSGGEVVRWIGPPESEEPAALVSTYNLGEQGQLQILSRLAAQSGNPEDESNSGVALAWIAIVLGGLALILSGMNMLRSRR